MPIAEKLGVTSLVYDYKNLASVKKLLFPTKLGELLLSGQNKNLTEDNAENNRYIIDVCQTFFADITDFQRENFKCLRDFYASAKFANDFRIGSPIKIIEILHETNLLTYENISPYLAQLVDGDYLTSNGSLYVIFKQLETHGLLQEHGLENIQRIFDHPIKHLIFDVMKRLIAENLWDVALSQEYFEKITNCKNAGIYHALLQSNRIFDDMPLPEQVNLLQQFIFPYAEQIFISPIHNLWNLYGILSSENLLEARIICDALAENPISLKAQIVYFLLAKDEVFNSVKNNWGHTSYDEGLVEILLAHLTYQAEQNDFVTSAIQNDLAYLALRRLIFLYSNTAPLELFLRFPGIRARIFRTSIDFGDLCRNVDLTLRSSILQMLMNLPEYAVLFPSNNNVNRSLTPWPGRRAGLAVDARRSVIRPADELAQIADNSESAMRALSAEEQKIFDRVCTHYQSAIDKLGGVENAFINLQNFLQQRYEKNPAKILDKNKKEIILPYDFIDFKQIVKFLTPGYRAIALEAYYQHADHTAARFLAKPNYWMSSKAEFVVVCAHDPKFRHADFEPYTKQIVAFWLAATDLKSAPIDDFTLDSRVVEFVQSLALIGRAHNWDKDRFNPVTNKKEKFDDLTADRPSCYSGIKQRLFNSLKGHELLANDFSGDKFANAVRSLVYQYYKKQLESVDVVKFNNIKNTLDRVFELEATEQDKILLSSLNIPENIKDEWSKILSVKDKSAAENKISIDEILALNGCNSHLEQFYNSAGIDYIFESALEKITRQQEEKESEEKAVTGFYAQNNSSTFFASSAAETNELTNQRERLAWLKSVFDGCFAIENFELSSPAKNIKDNLQSCEAIITSNLPVKAQLRCLTSLLNQIQTTTFFEEKNDNDDQRLIEFYNNISHERSAYRLQ